MTLRAIYTIPDLVNNNGKMSSAYYCNHIIKKVVKPWLDEGRSFILQEDCDSGHTSPVTVKCKELGIKFFYNAPGSPDPSPIEKVWRQPFMVIESLPYSDWKELVADAKEAWDNINQKSINNLRLNARPV